MDTTTISKDRRRARTRKPPGLAGRARRYGLVAIGGALTLLGVLMAPLPGPLGLPVTLIGLMLVLRNSYRARRAFIRFQHKHPRIIFPLRRLLRRDPEVIPVAWQQVLRIERLILPHDWRRSVQWRRRYFRRRRPQTPEKPTGASRRAGRQPRRSAGRT
jgi:hypothetical protein